MVTMKKAAQAMGRKGGKSKSPKKLAAAKANLEKIKRKRRPKTLCIACMDKRISPQDWPHHSVPIHTEVCDGCGELRPCVRTESVGFPKVNP